MSQTRSAEYLSGIPVVKVGVDDSVRAGSQLGPVMPDCPGRAVRVARIAGGPQIDAGPGLSVAAAQPRL